MLNLFVSSKEFIKLLTTLKSNNSSNSFCAYNKECSRLVGTMSLSNENLMSSNVSLASNLIITTNTDSDKDSMCHQAYNFQLTKTDNSMCSACIVSCVPQAIADVATSMVKNILDQLLVNNPSEVCTETYSKQTVCLHKLTKGNESTDCQKKPISLANVVKKIYSCLVAKP